LHFLDDNVFLDQLYCKRGVVWAIVAGEFIEEIEVVLIGDEEMLEDLEAEFVVVVLEVGDVHDDDFKEVRDSFQDFVLVIDILLGDFL
jgi:hypothetical protein